MLVTSASGLNPSGGGTTKAGYGHIQSIDWRINPRLTVRYHRHSAKKPTAMSALKPQISLHNQQCVQANKRKNSCSTSETLRKKHRKHKQHHALIATWQKQDLDELWRMRDWASKALPSDTIKQKKWTHHKISS